LEEAARFWNLNLPAVPDSVESSSQAPTDDDIEEEKTGVAEEFSEGSRAVSHADQEMSAGAPRHSSPSSARKPAVQLPMPYGCTMRVGRRRVAVRRARQVGTAAKRDVGCGGPSHAGRSRRRRQPQGAACSWHVIHQKIQQRWIGMLSMHIATKNRQSKKDRRM